MISLLIAIATGWQPPPPTGAWAAVDLPSTWQDAAARCAAGTLGVDEVQVLHWNDGAVEFRMQLGVIVGGALYQAQPACVLTEVSMVR